MSEKKDPESIDLQLLGLPFELKTQIPREAGQQHNFPRLEKNDLDGLGPMFLFLNGTVIKMCFFFQILSWPFGGKPTRISCVKIITGI